MQWVCAERTVAVGMIIRNDYLDPGTTVYTCVASNTWELKKRIHPLRMLIGPYGVWCWSQDGDRDMTFTLSLCTCGASLCLRDFHQTVEIWGF